MLKTLGSISSLLLAVSMLMFGHGVQSALVPLRAELEGFGTIAIGASISGYFAGFVIGCIAGPYLIYRAGHIRAYAAMVSLASAVALMHPLFVDEIAWIMFRFATGFCVACFYIVIESWLNERATNEVRGLIMSSYVIIALSGIMIGQFAVAFGSVEGYTLFILASIVVSVAVIPVALTTSAQPAPITLFRFRPAKLYATSPTAFVASLLIGVSSGSTWMLAPVFATAKGFDTTIAASFAATMIAGGAVSQWPIGRLSDRFDRRRVLAALALGSVIACFATGLMQGDSLWGFLVLMFLVGVFTHTTYAIAVAHAFDITEPDAYVETSSGLLLFYGIGSTIGPLIISIIMEISGVSSLFLSVAVVQIGMLLFLLWRIRSRAAVAEPDREDFDLASTAPVVAMANEEAADLTTAVLTPEVVVDAIELEETHTAVQLSDIGYLYEGDVEPDPTVEFLPDPEGGPDEEPEDEP
ncbi:MAG: MFS transporter [Hyphomicrobiales bacterium]|nr:MAG: MFS transporter [Hyphomicrobiales bacterium]